MKTPDALLSWFNELLSTLPDSRYSVAEFEELLEDPPLGITQVKFEFGTIPRLHKSGPKGWTYFPADDDGTRLARISCKTKCGAPVTIMVKLFKKAFTATDTDTYTITEKAIITIDNLNSHGHVEYRSTHPQYKRRKVTISK